MTPDADKPVKSELEVAGTISRKTAGPERSVFDESESEVKKNKHTVELKKFVLFYSFEGQDLLKQSRWR